MTLWLICSKSALKAGDWGKRAFAEFLLDKNRQQPGIKTGR